jgi:hypothetical protein
VAGETLRDDQGGRDDAAMTTRGAGRARGAALKRAVAIVVFLSVGLVASGCPVVRLADVVIQEDSIDATSFTLQMQIDVVEDVKEDSVDADGDPIRIRGIVGFWLPEGWRIDKVEIKGPSSESFAALHPVTKVVPFPRTFPHRPGSWWAFVTNCTHIPVGTWRYEVAVAIEVPEGMTSGNIGMIISQFEGAGNYSDTSPMEIFIDRVAAEARVVKADQGTLTPVNVSTGSELGSCNRAKVDRGPRGCSCDLAADAPRADGLLSLLSSLF